MARTRINRPLLESEILEAQDRSRSASEAARYLSVSYKTYKRWCDYYGIFDRLVNQRGVGIPKKKATVTQGIPLKDILEGKHPQYKRWMLKKRLFSSGYKAQKCELCGFDEKRLTDERSPLMLHHIDGDSSNHRFENLQVVCYNCYFLTIGNIQGRIKKYFIG